MLAHRRPPLPRLAPIALGIALLWGHCDRASAIIVQNCNDHGAGSLRQAVKDAADGETVYLTLLNCTKITLTTGQIVIQKDNLTLEGPGRDNLTIDGGFSATPPRYNRIFFDQQSTGLTIYGMTLTDAKYKGSPSGSGGCVDTLGSLQLSNATISGCLIEGSYVGGGGVAASKGVSLNASIVTGNIVNSDAGSTGQGVGGGIYSHGDFYSRYSTISNNTIRGEHADGGGVAVSFGSAYLRATTISGNSARTIGGLEVLDDGDSYTTKILNSTISGNSAVSIGGAEIGTPLVVANSTVAFNTISVNQDGAGLVTPNATPVDLESSIIALNTSPYGLRDTNFNGAVTGANNLVTESAVPLPGDTISACPLLGRLGDNGGNTFTHRLLPNSPALDAGNNASGLTYDQRGNGHPRTVGTQTDIGAFESAGGTADEIFGSEFENRCN